MYEYTFLTGEQVISGVHITTEHEAVTTPTFNIDTGRNHGETDTECVSFKAKN